MKQNVCFFRCFACFIVFFSVHSVYWTFALVTPFYTWYCIVLSLFCFVLLLLVLQLVCIFIEVLCRKNRLRESVSSINFTFSNTNVQKDSLFQSLGLRSFDNLPFYKMIPHVIRFLFWFVLIWPCASKRLWNQIKHELTQMLRWSTLWAWVWGRKSTFRRNEMAACEEGSSISRTENRCK